MALFAPKPSLSTWDPTAPEEKAFTLAATELHITSGLVKQDLASVAYAAGATSSAKSDMEEAGSAMAQAWGQVGEDAGEAGDGDVAAASRLGSDSDDAVNKTAAWREKAIAYAQAQNMEEVDASILLANMGVLARNEQNFINARQALEKKQRSFIMGLNFTARPGAQSAQQQADTALTQVTAASSPTPPKESGLKGFLSKKVVGNITTGEIGMVAVVASVGTKLLGWW